MLDGGINFNLNALDSHGYAEIELENGGEVVFEVGIDSAESHELARDGFTTPTATRSRSRRRRASYPTR